MSLEAFPQDLTDLYRPLRVLGAGGMGEVFLVEEIALNRMAAVKFLRNQGNSNSQSRFFEEARAMARISHPNIIQVYSSRTCSSGPYIVMEYVEGQSLHEVKRPMDLATIFQALAEGLDAVHAVGVLHRDIKPPNILLAPGDKPVLIDFGLARGHDHQTVTKTGELLGTNGFFAPEIIAGQAATKASDWYAWGVSLYSLAERRLPYTSEQMHEIVLCQDPGEVSFRRIAPGDPLRHVLRAALAVDPEQRPKDAQAFSELFARTESLPPTKAVKLPLPIASQKAPVSQRSPAGYLKGLSAVAGLAGLAFGVASYLPRSASPPHSAVPAGVVAERLLQEWRERVEQARVKDWISATHAALAPIVPDSTIDNYPREIWKQARKGLNSPAHKLLRHRTELLLWRAEFDTDRDQLGDLIADPGIDFSTRWSLYETLQALEHVDAYLEAWGSTAAYRVKPVIDRLTRAEAKDLVLPSIIEKAPDVPKIPAPPPGAYRIHRWPSHISPMQHLLVPDPKKPSATEQLAWMAINITPEEHGALYGQVDLGTDPAQRYKDVSVEVTLANLSRPNVLHLRWNQYTIMFRTPAERVRRSFWDAAGFPDHRVVWKIPIEALRPGRNTLKIVTRPTLGLPHAFGIYIDYVGLTLTGK